MNRIMTKWPLCGSEKALRKSRHGVLSAPFGALQGLLRGTRWISCSPSSRRQAHGQANGGGQAKSESERTETVSTMMFMDANWLENRLLQAYGHKVRFSTFSCLFVLFCLFETKGRKKEFNTVVKLTDFELYSALEPSYRIREPWTWVRWCHLFESVLLMPWAIMKVIEPLRKSIPLFASRVYLALPTRTWTFYEPWANNSS